MRIEQLHHLVKLKANRIDSQDKLDIEPHEIDDYLNKAIWIYLKERFGVLPEQVKRGFETDQVRISQLSSLHIKSPQVQPAVTPIELAPGLYEVRLNSLGRNINGQYFRYLFLTSAIIKASKDGCTKDIRLYHKQEDDTKNTYSSANWIWGQANYNFGKSNFVNTHVKPNTSNQDPDTTMNLEDNRPRFNNDELSSLFIDVRDVYGNKAYDVDKVCISYIKYPNRVFYGGYDHIDGMSNTNSPRIDCDFDEITCNDIVDIAVRLIEGDILGSLEVRLQDDLRNLKN